MQAPYEFEQFVKSFYPGSGDDVASWEEWIASILKFKNAEQRSIIKQFIEELLDGSHTDAEIEEIWRQQYPSYDFSAGGHRAFLTMVRDMLR